MNWLFGSALRSTMVDPGRALAGRDGYAYDVPQTHTVLGTPLAGPWPEGTRVLYVAMGCFWGAERAFWQLPGVVTTAVGYQGGFTPYPTYEETCTGLTGHTEAVLVAYDPSVLSDDDVLRTFWESHDPTQGYRQGNDVGTQYRSAVYTTTPEQAEAAARTRAEYQPRLARAGFGDITTEIRPADEAGTFFYAEGYHQQYLDKNPNGYCGLGGTGVSCPRPTGA
ncbi:peptide-methionine (S)-S-oxide reductase MsrA [Cellulomonas fimi]|uniref:Peptide methionine sulfoxide reductase MsrA n=1 Tax=Cellulomonas fimi (strain ATCC 484 / DSM 20113 / JCM 1341 / CCUG 24087 / LMG 16345 / NBRC 15513 / NCIMB 8980 / NCTC 7547 / NRS-133) TaxID=590998 RepID=F4H8R5_CELFA|nr:peptide-methionine (S)-S-oxide reductase MsrA [Cellulomonas fimi]AEE47073.1 peptide methionine sulfoxide reductase [Cellulomonas fimi ATCC 484]VEH35039.1 Peptide methionine sulfoxide reductase MsrA [Cellulomonas fimi]